MKGLRFIALLLVCLCAGFLRAQATPADPGVADFRPLQPTVWYQMDWPEGNPPRFSIGVDSSGHASYLSFSKDTGDPYTAEFTMSAEAMQLVFGAAERLRYFDGNFAYKKRIAFTGNKTLTYADTQRRFSTRYNYSENPDIAALTHLFQGISLTAEYDRRLQFMMRYNKLGIYDELKHMLDAANDGWLAELQIVAPRLQAIAKDSSVMHVARVKAGQILARAGIATGNSPSQ